MTWMNESRANGRKRGLNPCLLGCESILHSINHGIKNVKNVKSHSNLYHATYVVIDGFAVHESEGGHLTSQHSSCSSFTDPEGMEG